MKRHAALAGLSSMAPLGLCPAVLADDEPASNPGCTSDACYGAALDVFNETLQGQPRHSLHAQVNGSALRGLLDQLPVPAATTAPAAHL